MVAPTSRTAPLCPACRRARRTTCELLEELKLHDLFIELGVQAAMLSDPKKYRNRWSSPNWRQAIRK